MYLTNCSPRALIGAISVTTEAAMKDQQTLGLFVFHSYHRDTMKDQQTEGLTIFVRGAPFCTTKTHITYLFKINSLNI